MLNPPEQKHKMKKFFYFSLLMGLVLGALTLTACGSDDDEPAGGNIVGNWEANIPVGEIDNNYSHSLTYEFKNDNSFTVTTYSVMEDGFRDWGLRFAGTYSTSNGKLSLNIKKFWEYDGGRNGTDEDRWNTGENSDGSTNFSEWTEWGFEAIDNPLVIDYSVNGNTLTLNNGKYIVLEWGNCVLTGTLTKMILK